ncbi:MAG TPA: 6-phosphogluconolactonase [Candidatus Angelobacter sp.]|jgi:6-phosphogluconolactonase|nr:6-phosphogluconolactonase [Candidatus Angelobacter sp.]
MSDDAGTGLPGVVHVVATAADLADESASWLSRVSEEAREEHGFFAVALSGGSTPRRLHERLTGLPFVDAVAWAEWMVFFGDERAVPPDDPQSNYHMACESLLSRVPIIPERVHPMEAERVDRAAAAAEYAALLADTLPPGPGGAPRLHCTLLGLGENGHVASLFPGTPALEETRRWVVPGVADYAPFDRLTFTLPTINASEFVAILVSGGAKGDALRGVISGTVPAARVRPKDGTLLWFLDEEAAASMRR